MIGATKLPNSSYASSIDEAQTLVRRCAEPRPAADQVKAAIRRASQRLDIPFSRIRDIWYGDARRIDAEEMDRLRRGAESAEARLCRRRHRDTKEQDAVVTFTI